MTTRVKKKVGISINESFMLGTQTEVETDESLRAAEKFINNTGILASLGMITSKLFGERVKKNAVDTIGMSEQKILGSGFEGERKELPTKVAVKLLEGASLEDDKSLQDIWANLLANAVTNKVDIKSSYASILSEMSNDDVVFLNHLLELKEISEKLGKVVDIKSQGYKKNDLIRNLGINESNFELIVDNLVRLNLIYTGDAADKEFKDKSYVSEHMKRAVICFTFLGYEFVKACKYD